MTGTADAAGEGQAARPLVPRDAATLVVVDRTATGDRILMGRRRAGLAFLSGLFVFPGGRVDPADKTAPSIDELPEAETVKLLNRMRGRASPRRARALAMAAHRELTEETGIAIGDPARPALSPLRFIARAITPPGRIRRYDTRFFMAEAGAASGVPFAGDGELVDLSWFTLEQARALELPGITRLVLEDVANRLSSGAPPGVPFYFHRSGRFHREVL